MCVCERVHARACAFMRMCECVRMCAHAGLCMYVFAVSLSVHTSRSLSMLQKLLNASKRTSVNDNVLQAKR